VSGSEDWKGTELHLHAAQNLLYHNFESVMDW